MLEELQSKHFEAIDNDPLSIVIDREKASIAHTPSLYRR